MKEKYLEPLRKCAKILNETDGVNYIFLMSDAIEDDKDQAMFAGGSGWNIEYDDGGPDFLSMVAGLIKQYLDESDMKYSEKVKLLRELNNGLLKSITYNKE